jgi:nicotinamidase-related amidase
MGAALLVMDIQQARLQRLGTPELIDSLRRATAGARNAAVPVVFIRLAFREGYPEVSDRNQAFAGLAAAGGNAESDAGVAFHPDLTPLPGDLVTTKLRVSAFVGSALEVLLRARQIDTLVLTGIATSGVVLSTLTDAADRDFRLIVLSDGCVDMNPDLHTALTELYFPRMAQVTTAAEWLSSISR